MAFLIKEETKRSLATCTVRDLICMVSGCMSLNLLLIHSTAPTMELLLGSPFHAVAVAK